MRRATGVLLLFLISQAVFWLGLYAAESLGRPADIQEPAQMTLKLTDNQGQVVTQTPSLSVARNAEPAYIYDDPDHSPLGIWVYKFQWDNSQPDIGLLLGWQRRITEVRLNQLPLKTHAPNEVWGILSGHDSTVYSFPRDYLISGTNILEIVNNGKSKKILPYFFVGPLTELVRANTFLRIFSIDLVIVSMGVLAFALLLNLVNHWPAADKVKILSLNGLLLAWILRNLTFLGIDGAFPDPFRLLFHFLVTYVFLFAFLQLALAWTMRATKAMMFCGFVFVLVCLVTIIASTISIRMLFDIAFFLETGLTLVIGITVFLLFAEFHTQRPRANWVETILFLVCMTAVVVDAIDDRWRIVVPFTDVPLTFYVAPMCGLLMALGVVTLLAAQSTRARVAAESVNELLNAKLDEQERRLSKSYEREKAVAQASVLVEERQRIIRDMHDGVGGGLTSLLLRARRNELSRESLVASLSRSLTDLRLIIDSFYHVGDNLEFALATFRQRLEPEYNEAGVSLHVSVNTQEPVEGFGPQSVLHIYRILQEACSNAINHGQAKNLWLELTLHEEDEAIRISLEDDGSGWEGAPSRGSGIDNMHRRANTLGGRVSFSNTKRGTRVELLIPMRESEFRSKGTENK